MFIALLTQTHEGCDYSIACGKTWIQLKATNLADAILELKFEIIGNPDSDYVNGYSGNFFDENELKEVILLDVKESKKVPIGDWYKEVKDAAKEIERKKQESAERAEYKRLREKFES